MIEDYFGLGFSYSEVSSLLCWKLSLVGAFPLRSVCVPLINMHKGRVYDVIHCYNLRKKCLPPYTMWIVVSFLLEEHNRKNRLSRLAR